MGAWGQRVPKGIKKGMLVLLAFSPVFAFAKVSWIYMDTRQNRGAAVQGCKAAIGFDCENAEVDSREFANGNTFVQFSRSVSNRNIRIIIPAVMSPDTFM